MKSYKKSKLGLFLKILGSLFGALGIIAIVYILIKVSSFTNEFEMMLGKVLIVYGVAAFVGSLITSGTLWGIALILDNQIRIETKLDKLSKIKEIEEKIENKEVEGEQ